MSKSVNKRTFVGFSIGDSIANELKAQQTFIKPLVAQKAKTVAKENFHITAAFLGNTSLADRVALSRLIEAETFHAFTVSMPHIAHWPQAKLICAEGMAVDKLSYIANQLQNMAKELGLMQSQHDYRPHVSLFRHCTLPNEQTSFPFLLKAPITVTATQLTLFESLNLPGGVKYLPIQHWPLTP
ncbi:RNA 2',3'-cyclic phosphodiesterase [Shewanella sp. ENK2]|uniref:RNA 2',3'-cyclic phosphodiesterase n=1 Tax=Shewanella sp. ENK2 TaxID=2775245 RepID=UPI00374A3D1E